MVSDNTEVRPEAGLFEHKVKVILRSHAVPTFTENLPDGRLGGDVALAVASIGSAPAPRFLS